MPSTTAGERNRAIFTRRAALALPLALPTFSHAKVARRFTATVAGVSRGVLRLDTLQTLRLAHIDVPRPPQPWGRQGEAGLLALALGRRIVVEPTAREPDRRGQIPAEVWLAEAGGTPDVHLARELLRLGLARVRPYGEDDLDLAEWFAEEREARLAGRGLWRDYRVHAPDADRLAQLVETFQIIEGVVTAVGGGGERTYLNFGADWRTDVTVVVDRAVAKGMAEPPESLEGARVEARGWVELVNGPSVWLRDARALRVLD